jgi:hypothetical protein
MRFFDASCCYSTIDDPELVLQGALSGKQQVAIVTALYGRPPTIYLNHGYHERRLVQLTVANTIDRHLYRSHCDSPDNDLPQFDLPFKAGATRKRP